MPYTVENRGDEWCVIKSDGSVAGSHASKARAVSHQNALYSQDGMTAAVNGAPETHQRLEIVQAPPPQRVEIATTNPEVEEALIASVAQIAERLHATENVLGQVVGALAKVVEEQKVDREAMARNLTSAITAAANRPDPVINVTVPEQPSPTVNIHVPKSKFLIPAPVVNVSMPQAKKTVTIERDPLTGEMTRAEIAEDLG